MLAKPITLALATVALATGCARHHRAHDPAEVAEMVTAHVDDALDDLEATEAQRTQVHALKGRLLQEARGLFEARRSARAEMVAQWDADKPDAARIGALVDERFEATRQLAHKAADAAVELHGILTPEQRAQVSRKIHRYDPK